MIVDFKVTVDTDNKEDLAKVVAFLSSMNEEQPKKEQPKKEQPKKEQPKKEETEDDDRVKDAQARDAQVRDASGDSQDEPKHTKDELRKLLSEKVGKHKDAIKEKLQELGSPNISKLQKEHIDTVYEFMQKLK